MNDFSIEAIKINKELEDKIIEFFYNHEIDQNFVKSEKFLRKLKEQYAINKLELPYSNMNSKNELEISTGKYLSYISTKRTDLYMEVQNRIDKRNF